MEGLLWLHRRTKGNRQSEWRVVAYGEIVVECFVTFHHDLTLMGMYRDTHRVRASGMAVACRASSNFTVCGSSTQPFEYPQASCIPFVLTVTIFD